MLSTQKQKVVAISGGVGGAKLSQGLGAIVPHSELSIIVNTGDDSHHYGLFVAPDIDTQLYTLAGKSDPGRGWGQKDETWHAMDTLRELGQDVWFNIGDKDLGTKLLRTMRLAKGDRLTDITSEFAQHFGLEMQVLPMCDEPVSTQLKCEDGDYDFHDWFVAAKAEPPVREVVFRGAESARMTQEVEATLNDPDLAAIIVCPSNPYLSIAPVLAVPGMAEALKNAKAPVVGVTPIIAGEAIKGPTAEMMQTFGVPVTAASAANIHADLFDGYIIDERDADQIDAFKATNLGIKVTTADTLMIDLDVKTQLARKTLEFARTLA